MKKILRKVYNTTDNRFWPTGHREKASGDTFLEITEASTKYYFYSETKINENAFLKTVYTKYNTDDFQDIANNIHLNIY